MTLDKRVLKHHGAWNKEMAQTKLNAVSSNLEVLEYVPGREPLSVVKDLTTGRLFKCRISNLIQRLKKNV